MKSSFKFFLIVLLLSGIFQQGLVAQDRFPEDSTYNSWDFRVGPYIWLIGLRGEIIRPPVPPEVPPPTQLPASPDYSLDFDLSFQEIRNSIKFAFMLTGQYRNDFLVTQFNFSSFVIESELITPKEFLLVDNMVNFTYIGGDFGVGYRLVKRKHLDLDILLGAKFVYFDLGLSTSLLGRREVNLSRSTLWLDPVLGMNIKYRPHPRWEFVGYGDFGPEFIDGYNTYQGIGILNFVVSKHFMVSGGYRYYYVDNQTNDVIYRGSINGMLFRFCAQF